MVSKIIFLLIFLHGSTSTTIECPFPFETTGKTVQVLLQLRFYSLDDFQAVDGFLLVSGSLSATWHDPCGWNLAQRVYQNRVENATAITMDYKFFWIPVITQDTAKNLRAFENTGNMPLEVYDTGHVTYWGRKQWVADCTGSFHKFPFDEHLCELSYFAWEPIRFVNITEAKEVINEDVYNPDSLTLFTAEIKPAEVSELKYLCGNSTCINAWASFSVSLKRKWFPYYFNNIFLPMLLLAILQLSAFFIPHDEIDRITFSGTIFLSNAFISSEITKYIPQTAEHVVVVTVSNMATVGSMLAIVVFVLSYLKKDIFQREKMVKIQKATTAIFILFYSSLFVVSCAIIST